MWIDNSSLKLFAPDLEYFQTHKLSFKLKIDYDINLLQLS